MISRITGSLEVRQPPHPAGMRLAVALLCSAVPNWRVPIPRTTSKGNARPPLCALAADSALLNRPLTFLWASARLLHLVRQLDYRHIRASTFYCLYTPFEMPPSRNHIYDSTATSRYGSRRLRRAKAFSQTNARCEDARRRTIANGIWTYRSMMRSGDLRDHLSSRY